MQTDTSHLRSPVEVSPAAPPQTGRISALRSYLRDKGLRATIRAVVRALIQPVVRSNHHSIWETTLDSHRAPSAWADDERFCIIGPDQLDMEMTPRLLRFLGGENAAADLDGVRQGDRLLLVSIGGEYVYSGYIYFNTTRETRRQRKIYGETGDSPIIGTCFSTPIKIWAGPASPIRDTSTLFSALRQILPGDIDVRDAATGFPSLAHFVYTVRLSHDLNIPFDRLKNLVTSGKSLWKAVQELRPDVDAMAEVRKVWDAASIHRRVLNDVFRYLYIEGQRRAINEVLEHNTSSQKANIAVGMTVCRELRDWTIVGRIMVQKITERGRSRWRAFLV